MTSSDLTKWAQTMLGYKHFKVWRQNNHATRGRKFIGMPGLPDIIGHCRVTGRAVYCEVKTAGDRIRPEQDDFMKSAGNAGAVTYLATVNEIGDPILKEWGNGSS